MITRSSRPRSAQKLYAARAAHGRAKTGAVTVVQRTSSDLRLNPHLHCVFLDGAYHEAGETLVWAELGHLKSRQVGEVLEHAVRRMDRYLHRRGLLDLGGSDAERHEEPAAALAASAVSGREPPAGPQWRRGVTPLSPRALAYDKPLCASLDGFTLHAVGGLSKSPLHEGVLGPRYPTFSANSPMFTSITELGDPATKGTKDS